MATVIKGSAGGQINLIDTTGSIQLNGSDVLTFDSSGNVIAPNNITVNGNLVTDTNTFYVDSTNNRVGIGTSSPSFKLQVSGSGTQTFRITSTDGANADLSCDGTSSMSLGSPNGLPIRFVTSNSERMRIDTSGNLLIGTTSQLQSGTNHSIHIKSSTYPQITFQNTAASTSGSYWVSGQSSNDYWYLLPAPQDKGVYLTYTSTTGWSSFSDETLKENLVPIENALDKINTLRTVTGNYIDDPEHPHVFLIAQDVQAILPEAVHMNLDHNVLGMNYNEIIPLLTAGIKELKEENDTLKTQLANLETRIQALESA